MTYGFVVHIDTEKPDAVTITGLMGPPPPEHTAKAHSEPIPGGVRVVIEVIEPKKGRATD